MPRRLNPDDPRLMARDWQELTGRTQEEWKAPLLEGLPEHTKLDIEHHGGAAFNLTFSRTQPGTPTHDIFFEYRIAGGGMNLFGAAVDERGTNTAALVAGKMLKVVQEFDLTEMDVYAKEAGAYVWGRAGFAPYANVWETMRGRIRQDIDQLVKAGEPISPQSIEKIHTATDSRDPRSFWTVIDTRDPVQGSKLGVILSINKPWRGVCNLSDASYRDRHTAYATGQPIPVWNPQQATSPAFNLSSAKPNKVLGKLMAMGRKIFPSM